MSDISKPITQTDPRKVCSKAFFERIAARLVKEHPTFDVEPAERITEQGFAYLYTAAPHRGAVVTVAVGGSRLARDDPAHPRVRRLV
ncbi:hypothetical protein [Streptomyces sp. NPDC056453]|uniref:hypothetical protein n=1 Tax=Streptomyces sp. NPDC056453 TaxID=3345822 RepID=UPI00368A4124